VDCIYTPTHLAELIASYAHFNERNNLVADFSVGNGELLRAVAKRQPTARFVGIDINPRAISRLTKSCPSWTVARGNFLHPGHRDQLRILRNLKNQVSLVVLNPPFSNLGARKTTANLYGEDLACSKGLAFVITSLAYLKPDGKLFAILPANTLHSEMDRYAWGLLDRRYKRKIIRVNHEQTFRRCIAKTIVIKLSPRSRIKKQVISLVRFEPRATTKYFPKVRILRGKIDMPSVRLTKDSFGIPLLHTTELRDFKVSITQQRVDPNRTALADYAVLVPRVGRPSQSKICVLPSSRPVALSACILAIACHRLSDAYLIHNLLLKNWPLLKKSYSGTCAQYLTLTRLRQLLSSLGVQVMVEPTLNLALPAIRRKIAINA